jgi:hypothetical protein
MKILYKVQKNVELSSNEKVYLDAWVKVLLKTITGIFSILEIHFYHQSLLNSALRK